MAFLRPATDPGFPAFALTLRRTDPDRFVTTLLAPEDRRLHLLAVYALNAEVARIPDLVREPLLGRIRLQWWADAVAAIQAGAPPPGGQPVLAALAAAQAARPLPADAFAALFAARAWDHEPEAPMPDRAALTAHARATGGGLGRLALSALTLPAEEEGADHALEVAAAEAVGTAYALTGLIRATPHLARRRRLALPVPDPEAVFARADAGARGTTPPALRDTAAAVAAEAAALLAEARRLCRRLPRSRVAALLPAVVAESVLKRLGGVDHDPFAPDFQDSAPARDRRPLRLLIRAWRGVY